MGRGGLPRSGQRRAAGRVSFRPRRAGWVREMNVWSISPRPSRRWAACFSAMTLASSPGRSYSSRIDFALSSEHGGNRRQRGLAGIARRCAGRRNPGRPPWTPKTIDRHRRCFRLGRGRSGARAETGLAGCRQGRCGCRHRHRFVCGAALHFRDCAGRDPRQARFDQSSRPHQRHCHLLSRRLRLCRIAGVALDVRDGGDSGGRIWNRADVHSRQPTMAGRSRPLGPSPGRAETDSSPGKGGGRTQRNSAQRGTAEGALVRTAQSAVAIGDDRGRWTGHRAANHRHQHRHLLRPDYFQVRRLLFLVGGDSGQRRSRSRQRHL